MKKKKSASSEKEIGCEKKIEKFGKQNKKQEIANRNNARVIVIVKANNI